MVKFEPLDLQTWERNQHFFYFTKLTSVGFTISTELDLTSLGCALKHNGLKFYPVYLWCVTTVLNRHKEFRTTAHKGQVGYWSTLTPAYPIFHDDDKTFSYLWTEYNCDFATFYRSYLDDIAQYSQKHGILAKPDPLPNSYTVSVIPWIAFTGFALHSYLPTKHYLPTIEAGKFIDRDSRTILPISITAHHAVCDGYHVSLFLDDLQTLFNYPSSWIDKQEVRK